MSDPDEREHGSGRPRGSPEAERFDPPVRATRWLAPADVAWEAFVREVGARAQLDAAGLARVVQHGGIWLDAHPVPRRAAGNGASRHTWRCTRWRTSPSPCRSPTTWSCTTPRAWSRRTSPPGCRCRVPARASADLARGQLRARLDCPAARRARLDRQTSGVVLFARDSERAAFLGKALQDRGSSARTLRRVPGPEGRRDDGARRSSAPRRRRRASALELRAAPARDTAERDRLQGRAPRRRARARRVPLRGRGARTSCACTSPRAGRRFAATTSTARRSGRARRRAPRACSSTPRACARSWSHGAQRWS
jgi:hypothetical protein